MGNARTYAYASARTRTYAKTRTNARTYAYASARTRTHAKTRTNARTHANALAYANASTRTNTESWTNAMAHANGTHANANANANAYAYAYANATARTIQQFGPVQAIGGIVQMGTNLISIWIVFPPSMVSSTNGWEWIPSNGPRGTNSYSSRATTEPTIHSG